jgi:hypothetical protein
MYPRSAPLNRLSPYESEVTSGHEASSWPQDLGLLETYAFPNSDGPTGSLQDISPRGPGLGSGVGSDSLISSEFSASEKQQQIPVSDGPQRFPTVQTSKSERATGANLLEGLSDRCLSCGCHNHSLVGMTTSILSECSASEEEGLDWSLQLRYACQSARSFTCLADNCGRRFTRLSDLRRHHKSRHLQSMEYLCRASLVCSRATRGFSRKDKRKEHEWKIHRFVAHG